MITQIQKNLEDLFYETLGKAGLGRTVVNNYPNISAKEAAKWLTQGLESSGIGSLIKDLGRSLPGYDMECIGAFHEAVRRLIAEAKNQE